MFWVLKRTFYLKTHAKTNRYQNIYKFMLKYFVEKETKICQSQLLYHREREEREKEMEMEGERVRD